jgi:hypothetical protein
MISKRGNTHLDVEYIQIGNVTITPQHNTMSLQWNSWSFFYHHVKKTHPPIRIHGYPVPNEMHGYPGLDELIRYPVAGEMIGYSDIQVLQ